MVQDEVMVRKRDDLGGWYHEPPYTDEEIREFYKRDWTPTTVASSRPRESQKALAQKSRSNNRQNLAPSKRRA
jgi:hypothetical protein